MTAELNPHEISEVANAVTYELFPLKSSEVWIDLPFISKTQQWYKFSYYKWRSTSCIFNGIIKKIETLENMGQLLDA